MTPPGQPKGDIRAELFLRLYERQMTHYEKTQDVEWKGTFGAWTLLAAAIMWASRVPNPASVLTDRDWTLLTISAVVLHGVWLWRIHWSENADKVLWQHYRAQVRALCPDVAPTQSHNANKLEVPGSRSLGPYLLWLVLELVITSVMARMLYLVATR